MGEDLGVIRQLYDLPTIVAQLTGMAARKVMVCPMPFHQHYHLSPSFGMFVDADGIQRFKCFGQCGVQGDVIDFAGYYHLGQGYDPNNSEHIQAALAYLRGGGISAARTPLQKRNKPLDERIVRPLVEAWERALWENDQALAYLEQRGVLAVAGQFRLGYECIDPQYTKHKQRGGTVPGHYISIPTIQDGRIISVKLRRIDSYYTGCDNPPIRYDSVAGPQIGTGQPGIFNHDAVAFQSGLIFSPEGEFDVMLIEALGYRACCTNGGANVLSDRLELILAHSDPVWIEDDDEAGHRHAEMKQKMVGKGIIINTRPYKDLGDMYNDGQKESLLELLGRFAHVGCA
jgi:hypothetical protein